MVDGRIRFRPDTQSQRSVLTIPREVSRMDVSVIVPTRNRSALLATTLRTVVRQRDVDLEVIVVDDGSTDDTGGVVAALDDPRVLLIRCPPPGGVSAARNVGAAEAHGEWLAFLDDDDLWAPDKLACQLRAAREAGRDWVYGGAVVIERWGTHHAGTAPRCPRTRRCGRCVITIPFRAGART